MQWIWPSEKSGGLGPDCWYKIYIVYWESIEERETLRSPDLTIRWVRKVGVVGRRGGSQYRLTRLS